MPASLQRLTERTPLVERFVAVRAETERFCAPLVVEDYQLQSMADCSPPKWHLAHTAWFFETFVLARYVPNYRPFHPQFAYLFNSYYVAVGDRWPRPARGLLSRPTVAEVYSYRHAIDEQTCELIATADERTLEELTRLVELGLNHEQQHQELLLTDLKHAFSLNPLCPVYAPTPGATSSGPTPLRWASYPTGVRRIGHEAGGFAFDNEGPAHNAYVQGFEIATRPVRNGEFLEFIHDGGYDRPELWLSDGWTARCQNDWSAPLYWKHEGPSWLLFTLGGMRPLNPAEPACHISYYEADAYARWAGVRLPTEAEWETAAAGSEVTGNFLDSGRLHPASGGVTFFGDTWAWTETRRPKVVEQLLRLEGRISEAEMQRMNNRAQGEQKEDERRIASAFLAHNLGITAPAAAESADSSLAGRLLATTYEYLRLVVPSLLAAALVAVPLGVLAARRPRLGRVVLAATGVLQTIPSLALLLFMIPVMMWLIGKGTGAPPAIAALFLYSLLPIVRNTEAGLKGIPTSLRESAEALGLPSWAKLRRIELPLAAPTILAGVRTAAVINVGTATLGGFIGAGGYGRPILRGIDKFDVPLMLEGAIPAAVMALAIEALFGLVERAVARPA